MVLRCAWGTCNADERFPARLEGVRFILFPKPKTNLEKCLRWIKACGRPHSQLNVGRINKHKAVCSKHFVGGNGPTENYPDPIPADGSKPTLARKPPKRRPLQNINQTLIPKPKKQRLEEDALTKESVTQIQDLVNGSENKENLCNKTVQTDEPWISPMDILAATCEIQSLKSEIETHKATIKELKKEVELKSKTIQQLKDDLDSRSAFGTKKILARQQKIKDLFRYYTGITYLRFTALLAFLVPGNCRLGCEKGRRDIQSLSNEDCLFLKLCRLRHNFGLQDLCIRFGISLQSSGIIFNEWIDHMYLKLGQLSIWPHRDDITKNMPKEFKADFPTTLVIIDGTELRTQVPCGLSLQSQMYSDYKSSTTLKGLIGCDPRGTVVFVSELYTGSVSDPAITEQSGFYDLLKTLKSNGYVKEGDAIMADKGFTINDELKKLGLLLNIPPFAASGSQMSTSDTVLTQKIAKHRVHIERVIAKVKTYKILSCRVPTSLFKNINKIWSVCCHLTYFHREPGFRGSTWISHQSDLGLLC